MTNPSPELSPQADAHAGQAQISVTLRYFAAATEAAGRPEERLDLPAGTTLAALRRRAPALRWRVTTASSRTVVA